MNKYIISSNMGEDGLVAGNRVYSLLSLWQEEGCCFRIYGSCWR